MKRKPTRVYPSGVVEYARNEMADWRAEMEELLRSNLDHRAFNPDRESRRLFSRRIPGSDLRVYLMSIHNPTPTRKQ